MREAAYSYKEDNEDYEIIDGVTYVMSRHNTDHMTIEGNIFNTLKNYLKGKRCRAFNEIDVFFSDDDNFVPDVIVVCNPEIIEENGIHGTPDLVVEISSPSTARRDRMEKFKAYEKYGVKEYWIVSPQEKRIEVFIRKDDKLILDDVYSIYKDFEWNK